LDAGVWQVRKPLLQLGPRPNEPGVNLAGRRHAAVRDHLVEEADANADVFGRFGAGQTEPNGRLNKGSPRGGGD
jgi:hypothetical protein